MIYRVIGLMSGSSLDGLDVAYVQLEEVRGKWSYGILQAECMSYSDKCASSLQHATDLHVGEFLKLHTSYGRYLGEKVNEFIVKHELGHKVHFIASHGHTVFHDPKNRTTMQLGDGASIAAVTSLPVVSDLRAVDVALGGQGAPIVPIGDKLLFGDYDYLLNIGGIANITIQQQDKFLAYDVCPANQVLNTLALREGKEMDEDGMMAARGRLSPDILDELNRADYYRLPPPKSLSNEAARELVFPKLSLTSNSTNDLLHTVTQHIAIQVAEAVRLHPHGKEPARMLVTGGGAFNNFLVKQIAYELALYHVNVEVPDKNVVKFKEALVMALIGTLRWREEVNVLSSVTGATRDSVGGALWMGHS